MQTLGSPASVVAAIQEDAEAEAARIRETTNVELDAIRAEAANANVAIADREERLNAARRENEERVAKQEWEGRCAAIEQRERWMQQVIARAQESWSSGDSAKQQELVAEARAHLPSGSYEIVTHERGGCIVRVGDVAFDNSYEARARRLEPEWRSALSWIYAP